MAGQRNREEGELYTKDQCLLEISVNKNRQVNIVNVAALLAKRLAKEKQGDSFGELDDDHPVRSRLTKKAKLDDAETTLGDVYMGSAGVILRAVIRFKRKRREAKQAENGLAHATP